MSAAAELGIDPIAPGMVELYADKACVRTLVRRYAPKASDDPNVILHIADVPEALAGGAVMPLSVAVVDLLESREPRAVAATRRAWGRLQRS